MPAPGEYQVEFDRAMEAVDAQLVGVDDVIHGTIVSISGKDAYISYGGSAEAVMDTAELEGLDIGDQIEATVVKTGSEIRVSRKRIKAKALLDRLRTAFENRLPVEGKVTGRNKGGFEVNISGLRAFCPLSQIALNTREHPDSFIDQTLDFYVTDLSDDGRRIVVSRAAMLKEAAAESAAGMRARVVLGAELTGKVKTLTPFGAFVDLGGIDGLLHVSEMSRRRVTDPKDVVQIGQEVHVKVIKIENDGKRISLSMKELERDPWADVAVRFKPGTEFAGRIVRSTDFGYFVEVDPGVDGLVHISQLPDGVKPGDAEVAIGSLVHGWVREVDPSKKRLSLSLRAVPASKVEEERNDESSGESAMAQAFRRAMGTKPERPRVESTELAQAQQVLVASVVATSSETLESALLARLSYRAWLLEWRVGNPFRVILSYPEQLFRQDLPSLIIEGRLRVNFTLDPFVSVKDITQINRVALLARYPSGAVRGLSAELTVTGSAINVTLVDPLALLDPDSADLQADRSGMVTAIADIVAIEEME